MGLFGHVDDGGAVGRGGQACVPVLHTACPCLCPAVCTVSLLPCAAGLGAAPASHRPRAWLTVPASAHAALFAPCCCSANALLFTIPRWRRFCVQVAAASVHPAALLFSSSPLPTSFLRTRMLRAYVLAASSFVSCLCLHGANIHHCCNLNMFAFAY
jgi:hypothetical protein